MNTDVKYVLAGVLLSILAPLIMVAALGGIGKYEVALFTVTNSFISISVLMAVFKRWMVKEDIYFINKSTKITIKD